MKRLSIARSLRLALIGLTIVLAAVAGLGVASLYSSRQRYEDTLLKTSALSVAAANLSSTGVGEEEVLRDARGPGGASARQTAATAFAAAAASATSLAQDDPESAQLILQQMSAEDQARKLAVAGSFALASSPA